jgi:NhaP-type Na+/H+ or K+/H+ antiporter
VTSGVIAVVAAAVFGWGVLSARLQRADVTAPIAFVALGFLLSFALPSGDVEPEIVKLLAETTLVWVLFADAARVGVRELRADAGIYTRLLALALPLTVILGWLVAWSLVDGLNLWLGLLVGAARAPTDAARGAGVVTHPAVPGRIRRILNVESGLNDGIVTPVVLVALAGAAAEHDHGGSGGSAALEAVVQLVIGVAVGVAIGAAGGWLVRWARARNWIREEFGGPAVLALALLAYTATVSLDANGFIAAFLGGIAFGHFAGRGRPTEIFFVEQTAGLASVLVWLLVGALAVPLMLDRLDWRILLYAVASLTVLRMAPVALMLLGTGFDRTTTLFMGWFGPRGLASVVFALLAIEELGDGAGDSIAVIVTAVLMSVLAHGLSAGPLSTRFGPRMERSAEHAVDHAPPPAARYGRPIHDLAQPTR